MGLLRSVPTQIAWQNNLVATPTVTSPVGTTITAHADIHTKGSWTELFSATTYDSYGFFLRICESTSTGVQTDLLVDIGIGAAASEVVILPDFLAGWAGQAMNGRPFFIPLFIPRGARVAARCQALITADTVDVVMSLRGGATMPFPIFTGCDAYGINSAASQGTSHTPANTGSESSDATIGTATRNYGAVLLAVQGTLADTGQNNSAYHWELTLGGQTVAEQYWRTSNSEIISGPWPEAPVLVSVASGTAMQVQAECSGTAEAMDCALYCFY